MAKRRICPMLAFIALAALAACAQSGDQATPMPGPADLHFRLGPDDVIAIRALDADEVSDKQIRIGADGFINLPTVGRIKVAGLTVEQVQGEVVGRLKRLIVNPDVSVTLVESHSQPVTVVGSVRNPGVFQLQGRKTLLEIISAAGGPLPDAGFTVRITRENASGPLPLPGAHPDATGAYTIADVNLDSIVDSRDAAANIVLEPHDLINVPKAQMVYVIGEVVKPGNIAFADKRTVTVLQAISIAAGMTKIAKSSDAKILRLTPGSSARTEITVNLKFMLAGKVGDVALQPEDILYVPTSLKKDVALKTLDALAGAGTTGLIYRIP